MPVFSPSLPMHVLWSLPTHGDGRHLGTPIGGRTVDLAYLRQVAQAADALGYTGVLLPAGRNCEDPWVIASALVPLTERLRFLVPVRPGLQSPAMAARMTATLDRISGGRLLVNVVTGGDPQENGGDGLFLGPAGGDEVTDAFLTVFCGLLSGETVDLAGRPIGIEDGRMPFAPVQRPYPPLYFGGPPTAAACAAGHVDKYLLEGEPPATVGARIAAVRALAAARGRHAAFGIRLQVIVRDTASAAWAAADALIEHLDDATIAALPAVLPRPGRQGRHRLAGRQVGRRDRLEISPNLWAGPGLVRGGAGAAIVGDPETVAARLREYADLGVDTFVLSGHPHLEEAWRFGEMVLPQLPLPSRAVRRHPLAGAAPFGETIANDPLPAGRRAAGRP